MPKMAVTGIYDVMAKLDHYGQYEMAMPCSDDTYFIDGTGSDNTRRDIAHYTISSSNDWIESRVAVQIPRHRQSQLRNSRHRTDARVCSQ